MSTSEAKRKGGDLAIVGRIKDAMKRRRVSLRELSDLSEVPYGTLQSYLLAKHAIPAPALWKLAAVLEVSADWLVGGRPPLIDSTVIARVLGQYNELVAPQIKDFGHAAGAEMFLEIYRRTYLHEYLPPGRKHEAPFAEAHDADSGSRGG